MNSIIAFFFIWITYVDKKENVKKCVFEEMIEDLDKLHTKNMAIYLPAFTIGFLLYEQGIYVDNMKVLYNKMIVKEKKQYLFQRMVDSQIFYMTKNFNEDSFEYRRMLNQYFEWIAG